MAWGGSIGQVAQNEIVLSAQQRAAAERQLATLIQQMEAGRDNARQDRQLDQRDAMMAEDRRRFDTQMGADAAREARMTEQFGQNMSLQRDQLRDRQRDRRMDMLQRRRTSAMTEMDRAMRSLMPHAAAMADEGMFENIEDVIRQFPSLATQAPMLAGRSTAARRAIEGDLATDTADAALLNEGPAQSARLRHMSAMEKVNSWDDSRNPWWRSNQPDTAAIEDWQREAGAIDTAVDTVSRDRGRMGRLSPDTSGRFAPNTTLPWRPRTGTSTATGVAPATQAPQTQFKPGMMVIQNGVTYRFDGQNWNPLQ